MNKVSFETASTLKEAGFPQPEPAFGQVWYDTDGTPCIVYTEDTRDFVTNEASVFYPPDMSHLIYSPTATDILEQIPTRSLTFFAGDGMVDPWWQVEYFDEIKPAVKMLASNANHAEACAAAWLQINKIDKL